MSAQLPPDIEQEAEELAHGTELTVREAVVLLCDRDGYANESIRAHLGATKTTGELAIEDIGQILGKSNSTVQDVRASIREKERELRDECERIERTLAAIQGPDRQSEEVGSHG